MHHAVDAFLDFDKRAEIGEVADLAGDLRAGRILLRHLRPRVRFELADAKGYLLLLALDFEHKRVNFLADLQYIGSPRYTLGPRKLGDMYHTLDSVFQLHERAVRHHADNLAADLAAHGVFDFDVVPGVAVALLE